jgi:ABC-2 type transport system ATP-binding protein
LLLRLAADGVTIFLSTHSLAVAEELCDQIGIIDRGRLIALGTLDELRAQREDGGDEASLETVFLDILGAEATTNGAA